MPSQEDFMEAARLPSESRQSQESQPQRHTAPAKRHRLLTCAVRWLCDWHHGAGGTYLAGARLAARGAGA
jgi:hypothetical protein